MRKSKLEVRAAIANLKKSCGVMPVYEPPPRKDIPLTTILLGWAMGSSLIALIIVISSVLNGCILPDEKGGLNSVEKTGAGIKAAGDAVSTFHLPAGLIISGVGTLVSIAGKLLEKRLPAASGPLMYAGAAGVVGGLATSIPMVEVKPDPPAIVRPTEPNGVTFTAQPEEK